MDYFTITLVALVCYLVYNYFKRRLNYFEDLEVPYLPGWPVLGNMAEVIFQRKHLSEVMRDRYNVNKEAKYVGGFDFIQPVFILRDLELIKDVGIKHFEHFPEHKAFGDDELDPLFKGNLFNLNGERWKETRTILSPSFTSSKMKMMFHLIVDCAENLVGFMEEQSNDARKMIDSRDLFSKYTNDVIASSAFGISIDSHRNPQNRFYILGKEVTNSQGIQGLKFLACKLCPGLMKLFKIRLFTEESTRFFTNLISDAVNMREEKGITRPDVIQLMMETRNAESKYNMDITEMTAQAFVFFFAGFDTTASTLCIIAHELAINPDVQKRLQDEVDEVMSASNGKPTYEAIMGMLYLDAVMNEISRLHGQGYILDRVCKIPYELPPALPGLKPVTLQPGTRVFVPCAAIHRDPEYYENPDEFIPDRYYQMKVSVNDARNLNFGIGPRSCIGNRFALMEMKIVLVYLLAKFDLRPNSKTCIPLTYCKKNFSLAAEGGFWVSIEARN